MYISTNHFPDGLGPFLVTVHRPVTFFRVGIDFYWISYEKSIHWNLIKMCHIPFAYTHPTIPTRVCLHRPAVKLPLQHKVVSTVSVVA